MNALKLGVIVIITAALQASFLPAWRPLGVVPNVLVAVIVVLALIGTASQALICAMVTGLILDLTSATNFGQSLGFYTIVALGVSLLVRFGIAFDSPGWRYGLVVLAIVLGQSIVITELALAHVTLPFGVVAGKLLAGVIFELLIVTAVRPILGRVVSGDHEMSLGLLR